MHMDADALGAASDGALEGAFVGASDGDVVFYDFCSLPQRRRTQSENRLFNNALQR